MDEFEEIYKKYAPIVYRYVLSLGADESLSQDITADTFLKALKKIDTYDESCKISTWLCTIARNTYFSHLRKKDNNYVSLSDDCVIPADDDILPESVVEKEEMKNLVYKAMLRLDTPYKDVVYLRVFAALSFRKIGAVFDKNENWAKVTYHRAKIQLKGMIENEI